MTFSQAVLALIAAAGVVVSAGIVLARNGDVIAARTGLGGAWVGSVLVAAATSLPELATDISAVRMGAADLAAGDLFGSSMANMLILAVITLVPAGSELFKKAALDHVLYAVLAIILTAIAAIFLLLRTPVALLGVGIGSIVLLVTYAIGSRAVFRHTALAKRALATAEMSGSENDKESANEKVRALRRPLLMFLGAGLVVFVAAPVFARSAATIADLTGVGTTFIGTWLVGASTSLPELVTSFAAVRMRAYDLAVGNLFGSNAFNMMVFAVLDPLHTQGPILSQIDPNHALSALTAITLMGIGVAAIVYRTAGRLKLLEPSSALIVIGYFAGLGLLLIARS
ncbi:MAG: hypothetical protein AB1762_05115 [Gemmatimonadota bacterium]